MRDMIIAAFSIVLAGFVYCNSLTFAVITGKAAQNPAVYPQILAGILGLLGLILLGVTIREKRYAERISLDSEAVRNVTKIMLNLVIYVIGIVYLGFPIANALFVISSIMLLGGDRKTALKLCVPISVVLYLLFFWLFQIPMPEGLLWKLGG